jgi:hypothetical protein
MAETTGTGLPPNAEASDHPNVVVLLKAARALWEDDDADGAVRWFARAAEAAGDVGDDRRALELARAVADLKDKLATREKSSTIASRPPRSIPPPPPSARRQAASLRVSVKTSVRDPDVLIVRILKNGQTAPSGWGEATLAPTGRGFDLVNLRG